MTIQNVCRILARNGAIAIDFETTISRAHDRQLCTVQVCHEDGDEAYARIYRDPLSQRLLTAALNNSPAELVAHFAVFEWECFHKLGAWPRRVHCTYVAARVLHGAMIGTDDESEEEYGGWALDNLVSQMLGVDMDKSLQKRDWTLPLDDAAILYMLQDVRFGITLWKAFRTEMAADPDSTRGYEVIREAIPVIAHCNLHGGLVFDEAAHAALCLHMQEELNDIIFEMNILTEEIDNHGSAPQVSAWICKHLIGSGGSPRWTCDMFLQNTGVRGFSAGTAWGLTATGQLRLDKGTITRVLGDVELVNKTVGGYLRRRVQFQKNRKLLDAFGPKLAAAVDDDGCIRGSMIPHGARTTRMSCRDPNLQQMPIEEAFRRCFRARKGRKLVITDYGQIELRTGSIIADDKVMQQVFRDGLDIHAATATSIYALGVYDDDNPAHKLLRKRAKAPNFAALYGAQAFAIAMGAGISVAEAADLLRRWLSVYTGVARYREEMPVKGREQGYVQLVSGQKIAVVESTRPAQMINAPVQGGSATVMYRAMVRVDRALKKAGLDAVLALAVHDELLVDAAEKDAVAAARIVQREMIAALVEYFPLAKELGLDNVADASICDSWADKDNKACKLKAYIERMAA